MKPGVTGSAILGHRSRSQGHACKCLNQGIGVPVTNAVEIMIHHGRSLCTDIQANRQSSRHKNITFQAERGVGDGVKQYKDLHYSERLIFSFPQN